MANSNAITTKQKDFNNNTTLPADANNKSGEELLASIWNLNVQKANQISNISKMFGSKHGILSSVPIICRGQDCVYKDVCVIPWQDRSIGDRCPMEIAAILARYNQWCEHFGIDTSGDYIESKDLVDASLIKDLVNIEIQIMRAENKIALNGDFMAETLMDIDRKCKAYYGSVITPEAEYLMSLQDKKIKLLNQLNATRKDKANDKRKETASDEAVKIFQQLQEMTRQQNISKDITDVEFDEDGNIIYEEPETNVENILGDEPNGNEDSQEQQNI